MLEKMVRFNEQGLIPAIVQDYSNGQVLMMAYMNAESLQLTLETGKTWFYSRSRNELWMKGETSQHVQIVKDIRYDCDEDTLLILVEPQGPACHTNHYSCFYRDRDGKEVPPPQFSQYAGWEDIDIAVLNELFDLIKDRRQKRPEGSYTTYLFDKGLDKILKKVGEEAAEVIIAAKNTEDQELIYESADLIYHLLVLLVQKGVDLSAVMSELRSRR